MRTGKYFLLATLTMGLVGMGMFHAREDDKPKYTIKEVMKLAHKDGLLKKASGKDATKEDKEMLLAAYVALSMNKPTKGEEAVWKEKTDAIVKAAKALVADDKDAAKALAKATNCKACHEVFK